MTKPLPHPDGGAEGTAGGKGGEELAHGSVPSSGESDDLAPGDRTPYPQPAHTGDSEMCVHVPPCTEVLGGEDSKPTASEQRRALRHHLELPAHYTERGKVWLQVTQHVSDRE